MENNDLLLAIELQKQYDNETNHAAFDEEAKQSSDELSDGNLVHPKWELIDPNPNVHALFIDFNRQFFWKKLDMVEVQWSPRMTLCAGLCCYERRGGLCSVRLSKPLLSFRPRRDLVETLLHEMIHAYLFVTHNNKDHDAHGPEFCKHMKRINSMAGTNITVYHNFHDEVNEMRKHWWKCTGKCQHVAPYFGIVRRAMNRAPSSRDFWWADHQASCGGSFVKIKEPDDYGKKKNKKDTEKIKASESILKYTTATAGKKIARVTGGSMEKSNPRGIPLNSKLLKAFNVGRTIHNRGSGSAKLAKRFASSTRERTNLAEVCNRLRRTGEDSVNFDAPAFRKLKVVTKFTTSRGKKDRTQLTFESDDEFDDETSCSTNARHSFKYNDVVERSETDRLKSRDERDNLKRKRDDLLDEHDQPFESINSTKRKPPSSLSPPHILPIGENPHHTTNNDVPPRPTTPDTRARYSLDDDDDDDDDVVVMSVTPGRTTSGGQNSPSCSSLPTTPNTPSPSLPFTVNCPICSIPVVSTTINSHLDSCLSMQAIKSAAF